MSDDWATVEARRRALMYVFCEFFDLSVPHDDFGWSSLPDLVAYTITDLVPPPLSGEDLTYAFDSGNWSYPGLDLVGLRNLLENIDRTRRSIEGLDQLRTMPIVRRMTPEFDKEWEEVMAGKPISTPPEWIDERALAVLDQLREAVNAAAVSEEIARSWRPNGRGGRRPNRRAYAAALSVARLYRDMTQSAPTFWNGNETPYSRLLKEVFSVVGINAHPRRAAEWAIKHAVNRPE